MIITQRFGAWRTASSITNALISLRYLNNSPLRQQQLCGATTCNLKKENRIWRLIYAVKEKQKQYYPLTSKLTTKLQ